MSIKVQKVLRRGDCYSGVNHFLFKQRVLIYCTDKVTRGIELNGIKVIWNNFQKIIRII